MSAVLMVSNKLSSFFLETKNSFWKRISDDLCQVSGTLKLSSPYHQVDASNELKSIVPHLISMCKPGDKNPIGR